MTPYDKNKVEEFCRENFLADPAAIFYFFAFLEGGSLVPVRTLHQHRDFSRLAPWEQANVLYELLLYAETRMRVLRERYTKAARVDDDRQALIDAGVIVGP